MARTRAVKSILFSAVIATGFMVSALPAQASLIFLGPEDFQGTGLGAVNTILTIQSPRNSTNEAGAVAWNGAANVISGDAKKGASQTLTRTIGALGLTDAASLRVVFNALEPGNANRKSISLDDLVLSIYSPTGAVLFNSGPFTSVLFPDTFQGAGNSGFVFGLDGAQAAAAQAAGFGSTNNRIGLSAAASLATGGFETFFVANSETPVVVPEPASLTLLGVGLLGIAAALKARRKA